jgi:excisionase family DNA binding protein
MLMVDEELLTPEEVADRLKLSLRKVQTMAGTQITAIKVDKQWRFRRSDLQAYLERQTRPVGGSSQT